jgi:hypothetical protein
MHTCRFEVPSQPGTVGPPHRDGELTRQEDDGNHRRFVLVRRDEVLSWVSCSPLLNLQGCPWIS